MALVERLRAGGWCEEDAVHARNQSIASLDADYVPVLRLIESVHLLGGHLDLAKKLRPARGRRLVNRHAEFGPEPEAGASVAALGSRLPSFFRRIAIWFGSLCG